MVSDAQQDFALAFLSILFEGVPFILLGTVLSGFIDVYLPPGLMERWLPKKRLQAVAVAGLLGMVFPVCECAVVPVIRRLVKKGLPVSCGLTYMLAAPIVNPITALSTWKAFEGPAQWWMTGSRLALGYTVAVAVGWIVSRLPLAAMLRPSLVESLKAPEVPEKACADEECGCGHTHETVEPDRLLAAFRGAMKDFVDVAVYFSIGVALTAMFNTGVIPGAERVDGLAGNPVASPFVLMVLSFVLALCSTSDAFIAATLDKFSWASKLAFLVFGPMVDVKLIFLYQSVLKKRFIVLLSLGLFLLIGVLSILWQSFLFPLP
ncbi:MAG: permease [Luteolibacter sp.]